jgi:hypothetical protein
MGPSYEAHSDPLDETAVVTLTPKPNFFIS